jgi:hypothetical protein
MHSALLEWTKKTLHDTTRFVYLLVSLAIFDDLNEAAFYDRSILGDLLTKHNFESPALK